MANESDNKRISREYLANPFSLKTRNERLKKSGAIDLKNNCLIEDLGNGYCKFSAISKHKKLEK